MDFACRFGITRQAFVTDIGLTNHFIYHEAIHAFYGTYEHTVGPFSIMGGLRLESARITSDLVSAGTTVGQSYRKLREPHAHLHTHERLTHRHRHYPDIQHRYPH